MGVFPYSDVDNAASFSLDQKVDEETIQERQNRLMAIQQKISARKLRRFRGQRATALVEGPSKDTPLVWEARLEGMAPDIDGKLYLNDIRSPGNGPDRAARRCGHRGNYRDRTSTIWWRAWWKFWMFRGRPRRQPRPHRCNA